MKSPFFFFFLIINVAASLKGLSQSSSGKLQLSFGYAIQPQDRRLFMYPDQDEIINMEETKYDHQFEMMIDKVVYTSGNLLLNAGAGYSVFITRFSRPFNHNYFTGDFRTPLRIIQSYSIHSIKVGSTLQWNIIKTDKNIFRLILPVGAYIGLNKNASDILDDWHESIWKFEFNQIEAYAGIEYAYQRMNVGVSYRIFNLQKIDPVIFYKGLFDTPKPPFLQKKFESFNITKILFTAGYRL